jgi:hypothetical protein
MGVKFGIRGMSTMLLNILEFCENGRRDGHTLVTGVNKIHICVYRVSMIFIK